MKENKSKVLSLRVTQEEYDTISLLSMMNDISITGLLRGLFSIFMGFTFKNQEKLCKTSKLLINDMITKNKLN